MCVSSELVAAFQVFFGICCRASAVCCRASATRIRCRDLVQSKVFFVAEQGRGQHVRERELGSLNCLPGVSGVRGRGRKSRLLYLLYLVQQYKYVRDMSTPSWSLPSRFFWYRKSKYSSTCFFFTGKCPDFCGAAYPVAQSDRQHTSAYVSIRHVCAFS